MGVPDRQGKRRLGVEPQPKGAIVDKPSVLCCHLANTHEELPQRFHLLPNYFGVSVCPSVRIQCKVWPLFIGWPTETVFEMPVS